MEFKKEGATVDTNNYDFLRDWVIKPDMNVFYVYQWLGIEPGNWNFLYRFGGRPLYLVYVSPNEDWTIGDPIPENYRGLCRITTVNENKGTAGNYRSLSICEIVKKEEYVKDVKSVLAASDMLIAEFVHNGACQ